MTTPLGAIELGPREGRRVTIARATAETEITVTLGLDGDGHTGIDTGIGFYDHLLGSLAHHGLFDLAIHADGDLQIDEHHTVEDVALVLGAAFAVSWLSCGRPTAPARRARTRVVRSCGRSHTPGERFRAQRPPSRRSHLQGPGPGAPCRLRDRPAARGCRLDQGDPGMTR